MKKQRYVWLGISISMVVVGMTGCNIKNNQSNLTPTPTEKIREVVFQKREEISDKIITKTEGLCEVLEATKNKGTTYNSFNRMIDISSKEGIAGTSLFCIDERTGVIYFVNQGKDCFLYRMKEGEVALAVAMPVKDIYPYEDSIYFMVDDYGKYELQGMNKGDIYCYTPASGAVELVYATDVIEGLVDCHLYVVESGIYFCYTIEDGTVVEDGKEYKKVKYLDYYLLFGEKESVEDTKQMVKKGWGDYFFEYSSKLELLSRTPNEDGTRDTLEVSIKGEKVCVVGDVLYFKERAKIVATNLKTGETIEYDFSEAIKKAKGNDVFERIQGSLIESFLMTEDALWIVILGGVDLCRMDLQSGEVTIAYIEQDIPYGIRMLYTDGTELYGVYMGDQWDRSSKGNVVRLLTEGMEDFGEFIRIIDVESLTK